MAGDFTTLVDENLFSELKDKDLLKNSKVGLEKESLRVFDSNISKEIHPESFGSKLCNRYITTDFSEAQLEIITPPHNDKIEGLRLLEDIHHFITYNIGDQIIWPFSMPTVMNTENDVPIANFGKSNLGLFKKTYRLGLSHRYGRLMQAISGVHYNYSLPEELWQDSLITTNSDNLVEIRSSSYFNMLRNIFRFNWLILYLFGASPILTSNFITKENKLLRKVDNNTYYLPYATSLRMSHYGYCNSERNNLQVSMDSLEQYVSDLFKASSTHSNKFESIDKINAKTRQQINANLIQTDDEYYAVARAKSKIISDQRTVSKLRQGGVDFIELRSLDLNPYSRVGIDNETVFFLETLLIYCFIKKSPYFTNDEIRAINHNDSIVAQKGREPNLRLLKDGKKINLKEWGKSILENLLSIANLLDSAEMEYTNSINQMIARINDSNLTISGRILEELLSNKMSFIDFGTSLGESNKAYYLNLKKSENTSWGMLAKESIDSENQQKILDMDDRKSLDEFIENYMSN